MVNRETGIVTDDIATHKRDFKSYKSDCYVRTIEVNSNYQLLEVKLI